MLKLLFDRLTFVRCSYGTFVITVDIFNSRHQSCCHVLGVVDLLMMMFVTCGCFNCEVSCKAIPVASGVVFQVTKQASLL